MNKGDTVSKRVAQARKVAEAARSYQRRGAGMTLSVAKFAEKRDISPKALARALKNPSRRLRVCEEREKILSCKSKMTAAKISASKNLKLHRPRTVRKIRAPVRAALMREKE